MEQFEKLRERQQREFDALMQESVKPLPIEFALFKQCIVLDTKVAHALMHARSNSERMEILASSISASSGS